VVRKNFADLSKITQKRVKWKCFFRCFSCWNSYTSVNPSNTYITD